MRLVVLLPIPAFLVAGADAFVPSARGFARYSDARRSTTARSFGVDPSHFADALHHFAPLSPSSSLMISDAVTAATDAATSAGSTVVDTVTSAASNVDAAVAEAAGSDNGWFGFLTAPIEGLLQIIHSLIASTGSANAWGVSIIILTLLIKLGTFPLTKTQLESTNKMQAMQPAIKEIQAKYQSNPEVMNQKIAEFYQVNEINPLAGCFPSLVQIPIFIGLYRAVLELAKDDKLNERFFFLPSLEGPTYGAEPATASDWILKGWVDGTPSLGWDDTLAFLILPIFLVVSQFVSMELMQPKTQDPAQAQSNVILKILPLMIGWFSLSVPSALSVYWVTNNIVTTASSLWIRNSMKVEPPKAGGGAATAAMPAPPQTLFSPPREKPSGFGDRPASMRVDGVKPITAMDAEIVDDEEEDDDNDDGDDEPGVTASSDSKKKRRGGKKKKN